MTDGPIPAPAQADPWAARVVDLESLHAEATTTVLEAVERMRASASGKDGPRPSRPVPIVVLGTAGIGKTHLFARLRRKLGPRAVLVHIRPVIGSEMTPRYLLGQILEQLGLESFGVRQIDALVGAVLAPPLEGNPDQPSEVLELFRSMAEEGRNDYLEHFIETSLQRTPDLDEAYMRQLLRVPFVRPLARSAALTWLGGQEVDEIQGTRIGGLQTIADDRVVRVLKTLALMSAPATPLVLVFDQLENLADATGWRVLAYGNLIAELVDVVRHVVIVQMALDTEWELNLKPRLGLSQRDRVMGRCIQLGMPSPDQAGELLRLWHRNAGEPCPWPFSRTQLDAICLPGTATPRMLLHEFNRALLAGTALQDPAEGAPDEAAVADALSAAWERNRARARSEIDLRNEMGQGLEPAFLADGLVSLAALLDGLSIPDERSGEFLRLDSPGGPLVLGFVHPAHHKSIGAVMARLGGLPPGRILGIREHWRAFKPTWKATHGHWHALLQRPGFRWHWLDRPDAERLLALASLMKDARSRDIAGPDGRPLEPEQVERWLRAAIDLEDWRITRALRGADPEEERETARPEAASGGPPILEPGAPPSPALELLLHLRVASIERIERDLRGTGAASSRLEILKGLKAAGRRVKWFGEAIVSIAE